VHADIDPAEISKNRRADVPIVGDCKEVLVDLIEAVRDEQAEAAVSPTCPPGWKQLEGWRETFPLGYDWPSTECSPRST